MKLDKIVQAIAEAERFIVAARNAANKMATDDMAAYGCKETATARRASMDLTRALAEMRKA